MRGNRRARLPSSEAFRSLSGLVVCPARTCRTRPGGTVENSPAIHRWDRGGKPTPIPEGQLKSTWTCRTDQLDSGRVFLALVRLAVVRLVREQAEVAATDGHVAAPFRVAVGEDQVPAVHVL